MLAQTIVLAVQTLVMFLTGLVVIWYTYETLKIRKETSKQNALLVEQLSVMRQSQDFESKKLAGEIDPILLTPPGPSLSANSMEFSFPNQGGMAKNLSVKFPDGFYPVVFPTDILQVGKVLKVTLSVPSDSRPKEFSFEIHYENRNGDKRVKTYRYSALTGIQEGP